MAISGSNLTRIPATSALHLATRYSSVLLIQAALNASDVKRDLCISDAVVAVFSLSVRLIVHISIFTHSWLFSQKRVENLYVFCFVAVVSHKGE